MNLLEILSSREEREAARHRIYGVVVGVVTNNDQGEEGLGRVKVKFPWLEEEVESTSARLVSPMAGGDRGLVFIPDVGDEVLVAFDHGDVRAPYIIGALWNGVDKLPAEKRGDDENHRRLIKSRSRHMIMLDDTPGSEKIEITASAGHLKITIDSSHNTMTLQVDGDQAAGTIELLALGGKIRLDAKSVEIHSSDATTIKADSSMNVQATSTMVIKGQTVNIN
jgi:uncharacterized protein involved in type VI secretion and phage assembly